LSGAPQPAAPWLAHRGWACPVPLIHIRYCPRSRPRSTHLLRRARLANNEYGRRAECRSNRWQTQFVSSLREVLSQRPAIRCAERFFRERAAFHTVLPETSPRIAASSSSLVTTAVPRFITTRPPAIFAMCAASQGFAAQASASVYAASTVSPAPVTSTA